MITPREFQIDDFIVDNVRAANSLRAEALSGSVLVDNLILLRFCDLYHIQRVLAEKYTMDFAWLNVDPTPEEYRGIATKHNILIERSKSLVVYIPLGTTVDDALLLVDVTAPSSTSSAGAAFPVKVRYIADCNLKLLQTKLSGNMLSFKLAEFRPLLVFRRLIMDCIAASGTDMHFESRYVHSQPHHVIQYRVKRNLELSSFEIDFEMMQKIIQTVVGKLTPTSSMDVDAAEGITTEVRDLFGDATCDLRITGVRVSAGYYYDFTIQTTNTTTLKIPELGFIKEDVDTLRQLAQRRTGLTLVTGEMRSGKNTTIFAMLNEIIAEPIRIIEYSNPIENHMSFPQVNYQGNLTWLKHYMRLAKKQDIDIAVLNEIPNAEIAFAVVDLVNSAVGVITTTHLHRVWHLPYKLREFFQEDYKTVVSQLNAVINHKMFRRWKAPSMQKRMLVKEHGPFELFCYTAGVRQYFVPTADTAVEYELQPLVEIFVMDDAAKSAMLNFEELWRAEQMIRLQIQQRHGTLEERCARYVNEGVMSLEEMRKLL